MLRVTTVLGLARAMLQLPHTLHKVHLWAAKKDQDAHGT
jgi:hypothetical protein